MPFISTVPDIFFGTADGDVGGEVVSGGEVELPRPLTYIDSSTVGLVPKGSDKVLPTDLLEEVRVFEGCSSVMTFLQLSLDWTIGRSTKFSISSTDTMSWKLTL